MRTLAWWNTAPEEPPSNKPAQAKPARKTRLQARKAEDDAFVPHLPEIASEFAYLVSALFEAGPVSYSGAGAVPLTWFDLKAWKDALGTRFRPWELRVLRRLSEAYLAEQHVAEDRLAACPWLPDTGEYIVKVGNSMRDAIRAMAAE